MESTVNVAFDIWKFVKGQGISFVLILVLAFYFYQKNLSLEMKVDKCNDQKFEILIETVNNAATVIERNNQIIEKYRQ